METLRHENLHHPYDGSMTFMECYKEMTKKMWRHNPDECKFVCRNPFRLLQTLIWASQHLTFYACWYYDPPSVKDLKDLKPSEVTADQLCFLIPQYIRSIQGHSGQDRIFCLRGDTEWNITPKDTIHVYHYGRSEILIQF